MNLAVLLANAARSFPDRPAVTVGDTVRMDYRAMAGRAARLAAGLTGRLGLEPGARVAVVMSNRPHYLEVLFGIWHAGLAAVPVNARLHRREIAYILDNCAVAAVFTTDDLAEDVAAAAGALSPQPVVISADGAEYDALLKDEAAAMADAAGDDLAWIFYTSGTTGRPKGAMLSHRNLMTMALGYLADIDLLTEADALVHSGPQSHAAGLFGLSFVAKASQQVLSPSGGFDLDEFFDLLGQHRNLTLFLAPTMLRRVLDDPRTAAAPVDHIRTILSGAAPIYPEDIRRTLAAFGPRFWNGYGQGESPCTITAMPKHLYVDTGHPDHQARIASVGIARTGMEVRVVDGDDRPLPVGEVGEIVVRGDTVMAGYWRNPEASAETLRGGWLHTGDMGAFDGAGFLTLKDRSKDMIISGGVNIYPREVEEVLTAHPLVAEAAVVGAPDAEWGERVTAFVVARQPGLAEAELDALCLEHIARFKRPKAYHFVEALPKNNYGKVLKTELRARLKGD
ncbi:AMP-binding protein [Marinibaculum pumilum]|uniref:AMP-binding protein n=1 Tax=Marinibaculum pumilum TaxID=1766165 RepID=A0ABV7L144_9PROT